MNVQLPDGTLLKDVPDGTTKAQIAEKLKANGRAVPDAWMRPKNEEEEFEFRARAEREAEKGPWTQYASSAEQGPWTRYQKREQPASEGYWAKVRRTALGEAQLVGAGVGNVLPAAGNAAIDLASRATGFGPRPNVIPQFQVGQAGRELVQNVRGMLPRTQNGLDVSDQELRETLDPSGKVPIEQLRARYAAERGKPLSQAFKESGTTLGSLAGNAVDVAGDVAALAPAAGLARGIPATRAAAGRFAAAGEERTAVRAAEQAPRDAKIAKAKEMGLRLPPKVAGGPVGKAAQSVTGKDYTEKSFSETNAPIITRIAKKEIGLDPKAELTEDSLDRLKEKPGAVYERVKSSGRVTADGAYQQALKRVRSSTMEEDIDFPEDTHDLVDKEIAKFDVPGADARSIVTKVQKLRERAAVNFKGDADHFELARAQKGIADAMEGLLDRHLSESNPGLIRDFRAARQQFAKIYDTEAALGDNGQIAAAALYRMKKRGVPLSGGLKDIADAYGAFGKYMRHDVSGHTALSRLDVVAGGLAALAHPAGAAKIVGALAARPVTSAVLRSRPYQALAIKPRPPKPSITARIARKVASSTPTLKDLETSP